MADPASPDYRFFARPAARPRSHHLHVCEAGGPHEARHIAVRDFLRTHPGGGGPLRAPEAPLAAEQPQDRLAYIAGKARYMDGLEARALAWAAGRGPAPDRA